MRILGAVIAGGRSSRMGGEEKALVDFGDRPLISHIVGVLQKQVNLVVINANGDPARFDGMGCNIIGDLPAYSETPLAGVAAALTYGAAQEFDAVVTTPSDTPFLPPDLVERLSGDHAAIARSDGQDHYLTGFWPVALAQVLDDANAEGALKRMQDWVTHAEARKVEWSVLPFDPFFNVNSPHDLALARYWLETRL